jgi:bla regulator protein BlaR1
VLFRLIFPLSFTSAFSFLNIFKPNEQANTGILEYFPHNIGMMQRPSVEIGVSSLNNVVKSQIK